MSVPSSAETRAERVIVAALAVTVTAYVVVRGAALAGVTGAGPVAAAVGGFLWLVIAVWVAGVDRRLAPEWLAVCVSSFTVAGLTQLLGLRVDAPGLALLNTVGLWTGTAVLVAGALGYGHG